VKAGRAAIALSFAMILEFVQRSVRFEDHNKTDLLQTEAFRRDVVVGITLEACVEFVEGLEDHG
jgi:hypothetical protein